MPDWSYRTFLRPLMRSLGARRSQRLAVTVLGTLSRHPVGLAFIDFLGHMHPDERLQTVIAGVTLPGPIALGSSIDPAGEAVGAFSRFGVGLIEVGPVTRATAAVVAANLGRNRDTVPTVVHIGERDAAAAEDVATLFEPHAAMFVVDDLSPVSGTVSRRPVLVRTSRNRVADAIGAGASGIWLDDADAASVRELRGAWSGAIVAAGRVNEPADAWDLLEAGADVVVVASGLVDGGPGLVKRCNEALLATIPAGASPEPLTLEAGRRAWFWGLLLGVAMFAGGILAAIIGSTRVIMPYDESLCGLTRAQVASINPRLLPFMAHDRLSLAGTMLSIGIFYMALAWSGIRRGESWARAALVASASIGFITFFYFLGFEYFDPFHAFVTAILTQFTLLCIALPPSPKQPPVADWRETPAWRAGQWGQLLFVMIGIGLTAAGAVISVIGFTSVFVETDLAYMRTTAAQLRISFDRLVPLVAHDRATLGGMLIANGIVVWLAAQWGMRAGARWLWLAFAWGGNIAFAIAIGVHLVVGYDSPLHLAPAFAGLVAWNLALALTREWLRTPDTHKRRPFRTLAAMQTGEP